MTAIFGAAAPITVPFPLLSPVPPADKVSGLIDTAELPAQGLRHGLAIDYPVPRAAIGDSLCGLRCHARLRMQGRPGRRLMRHGCYAAAGLTASIAKASMPLLASPMTRPCPSIPRKISCA